MMSAGRETDRDESEDAQGSATFGKYQLFAKLGSGGMAEVFLAVARGPMGFNKLTVIKRLRSSVSDQSSVVDMFLNEARLAARLTHPNIVHTYEVGEHQGVFFIAMEYLEGQPLNRVGHVNETKQQISPVMWARIIADALNGLHTAHELRDYDGTPIKIVHRDISPQNIFLTYTGETKIVDFGIAKAVNTEQTEAGVLKGKVRYMAPEQALGKADRRSDLFSMGIVLWEMLAQKRLFEDAPAKVLTDLVRKDPVARLSSVCPHIDPALDEIVAKALEKDPNKRYQTAEEMREALEAYILGTGEVVREVTIERAMMAMFQERKEAIARQVHTFMTAALASDLSGIGSVSSQGISESDLIGTGTHSQYKRLSNVMSNVSRVHSADSQLLVADVPTLMETGTTNSAAHLVVTRWGKVAFLAVGLLLAGGVGLLALAIGGREMLRTSVVHEATPPPQPPTAAPKVSVPLALASEPGGAVVDWNGVPVGRTPARIDLPPGRQTLIVTKDGYVPATLVVELEAGSPDIVRQVTLTPIPKATAVAASTPPAPMRARSNAVSRSVSTGSAPTPAPATPLVTAAQVPSSKVKVLEDDDPKTKVLE
ncbi:serine/threonine protein kinase [Pendulispora albinea]|uniref:Protein kinase n=1 Tax=Pendulispora albinea TaxID=2741071 RepID=A0ABZ2LLY6_9BACT